MIAEISKIWNSKPRNVLGIMTGTSLDGIDLCLAEFSPNNSFKVLSEFSSEFSETYSELMLKGINEKNSASFYSTLNVLYSEEVLLAIQKFESEYSKLYNSIDAIAIHGQTIWHNPLGTKLNNTNYKSTWQLCEPSLLSKKTGKIIVSDFRAADIALGGQAAPLVPIFDLNFLSDKSNDVICLNIGGMANLTYIPKNLKESDMKAFDTGPGNVLIDLAANEFYHKDFDENGNFAKMGSINSTLFEFLNNIEFIHLPPPKSTGRELFDRKLFEQLIQIKSSNSISNEDFIHTLTYFTAHSISINIKDHCSAKSKIIVSGGGSKNSILVQMLQDQLPKSTVINSDSIGISSTYKESLAFAYIAWRTLSGLPSNLPSFTGASKEVTLGSITFPN